MNLKDSNNTKWMSRLERVECRDSTNHKQGSPLVLDKAQGSILWDIDQNAYIDLCAGFGSLALGHNPEPAMKHLELLSKSSKASVFHGLGDLYPSKAKIELLEALVRELPEGFDKGILTVTGSGAVEAAVKTAFCTTKKRKIIAFEGAYHGLDLGILPLTHRSDFSSMFEGFLASEQVRHLPFQCSDEALEKALKEGQDEIAAVIIEPIQGRAGVREAKIEWLKLLHQKCQKYNILLIFDEIFTGLGRSGRFSFAEEASCDILCLGKMLGGGQALSACFASTAVMDRWPGSQGEAIHTGTFFGHPFSCSLGLITLEAIIEEGLVERSRLLGAKLKSKMQSLWFDNPRVRSVRGQGLMIGIECYRPGYAVELSDLLKSKGLVALPSAPDGSVLSLSPALNIPEALFEEAIEIIDKGIAELS